MQDSFHELRLRSRLGFDTAAPNPLSPTLARLTCGNARRQRPLPVGVGEVARVSVRVMLLLPLATKWRRQLPPDALPKRRHLGSNSW